MVRAFTFRGMKQLLLAILTCASAQLIAQGNARYSALVKEAFDLYDQKEYMASAVRYSAAFQELGWKGTSNDRYNAACSYALAGVPDSAFFHLYRIVEMMDYSDKLHITNDADLTALRDDARWQPLIAMVQANKDRLEANLDKPLVALLDSIRAEDQRPRHEIEKVASQFGRDSKEMQAHWQRIRTSDSTNLIAVTRILDERGWLGADVVGANGSSTLFLVIQHADLATQEKYLPLMREAVSKGNARGSDLALLEDRVLLRNGKRQLYGSQIGRDPDTGEFYLSPLDDPDNVDRRRAAVGLGPLAEYLMNWNLKWDPAQYELQLPILEQRYQVINR